jgi:eukaryotic-like serine/threonine-protein kinase
VAESGNGIPDDIGEAVEPDLAATIAAAQVDDGPTLVLVESSDGLVGSVPDLLPESPQPPRRVIACEMTRAKVGGIAAQLDLDNFEGGDLVVENAQWADPTSLGRLQRLLARHVPRFVVISHEPVAAEDSWWLDQLADAGREHGSVIHTTLGIDRRVAPVSISDEEDRALVVAAGMVADPISVPVAAGLLETDQSEALARAEHLVSLGALTETRSGFCATPSGLAIEVGEARRGLIAGRLASVLEAAGEDPGVIGNLKLASGDVEGAYSRLRDAALAARSRSAMGEAFHLASAALAAAEEAGIGEGDDLGQLHLISGMHLRAAGRSDAAEEHLDGATSLLSGPARIDALGFAASVADDRQHPQDSERILAMAEWEAATQGEIAKLGSLGTFRARALNRLGFAAESDAVLAKSEQIVVEHAAPIQQFYAQQNRAWILFDRGEMARAEVEFSQLRDHTDVADTAGRADKEAWLARALFGVGRPAEAVDAVETARQLASQADVEAPLFLADLALAEGNLLYERPSEALEAADRVWDLVDRQLPSWLNVALANRARALLALARTDEARSDIEAALEATPPGANGWRWRSRCRAIEFEVAGAEGSFPKREAEDLADMFLQSEYYGWAAELTCVIAEQTKDSEAAREAMALALQVGNPMLAARAAQAGDLWKEPGTAPVIRGIRAMEARLPEDWEEAWRELSHVTAALNAPEPAEDESGAENFEILETALRRAGLASTDTILSPAQRRSNDMVRHRPRRRSKAQLVAAALGVVVLAGATSFAVAQMMDQDDTPITVAEATPDTTVPPPLTLEETQIDVPVDLLFGTALDRGDTGRSGFVDVEGPRIVDGYYWIFSTADAISATPIAFGNNLLVGGTDGVFRAIDLTVGESVWSLTAEAQIATSSALGVASLGEGRNPGLVVVVGDDGVVRARDAVIVTQSLVWPPVRLGAPIRSAPVVEDGRAYVASRDGVVHAIDLASGNEIWRYPAGEEERLGAVTAGLALHDGVVYVGTEAGTLHLINVDGTLHCEADVDAPITVNPIVVDDTAYISTGFFVNRLPAGVCEVPLTERVDWVPFLSESVVDVAPAVVGDLMYVPNQQFLNAIDLTKVGTAVTSPDEIHHWSLGKVIADAKISTPPVVTRDAVYFGTESGRVYAVDADTGDVLWEWQTGNFVRASPVVVEGAVYIASGDGSIYAVGPAG